MLRGGGLLATALNSGMWSNSVAYFFFNRAVSGFKVRHTILQTGVEEFASNTKKVVVKSTLTKFELSLHQERKSNELLPKGTCRK